MFKRFQKKITSFLLQGITARKLAFTVAIGVCLGTIPLLGATSLLCMLAAFIFKLNMPAIQVVNYVTYPVQLLLYIPFLKAGTHIFSSNEFDYSLSEILEMLQKDMWQTINDFLYINIYGILLWLLISPFVMLITFWACNGMFTKLEAKVKA